MVLTIMIHIPKEVAGEHIGVGNTQGKRHCSGPKTGRMLLNIPLFVCRPMRTKNSSRLRTGKVPERIILSDSCWCFISKIPVTPPSCEYHVTKPLFIDQWKEYFPRFVLVSVSVKKVCTERSLEPTLTKTKHGDVLKPRRRKTSEKYAFTNSKERCCGKKSAER